MRALLSLLAALLASVAVAAELQPGGDGFVASGDGWRASFTPQGYLATLAAGDTQFLRPGSQGGYFYQDGVLPLDHVALQDGRLVGAGDRASMSVAVEGESLVWTLANPTQKLLLYVLVLDPAVAAARLDGVRYKKAPLAAPAPEVAFYRDGARLDIEGGTRIWGPFAQKHQVWEVRIAPGETATVRMALGPAPADEQAAAAEAAAYVPEPPTDPVGPMWDLAALSAAPRVWPAEGFEAEGLTAWFFESVPYEGRPTRVFCWVGVPQGAPGEKVPGMVLVHGGGGTAFADWVKLWNERGYAAIAMDTCGSVPVGRYGAWQRHPHGGPSGWGGWHQIDEPRTDQWTYHAVAAAILAHSLLRSRPEVDAERIGVTGISWGGYLTSLLAGVDDRFRFAAPVYGTGFYEDTVFRNQLANFGEAQRDRWLRWWDPKNYLPDADIPMLWVTGTNDHFFWLSALRRSAEAGAGPDTFAVRVRMPHSHPAGEPPEEIAVFADSLTRGGPPLPRITDHGREGARVWAAFESAVPLDHAELVYTLDDGEWEPRQWQTAPAELGDGRAEATLPQGTVAWFINLIDERGCVVSSPWEEGSPAVVLPLLATP